MTAAEVERIAMRASTASNSISVNPQRIKTLSRAEALRRRGETSLLCASASVREKNLLDSGVGNLVPVAWTQAD